jgi:RHH-type transcriptional regulator, proline utilization regulon repressor / proline dehydrogenase / delta 1-pyrroline-5-carboxylate dehydrogenase
VNGFMRIDMEQYKFKDITLEVYRRLRSSAEFRDYPHLGIVLQAYLKDTDQDLADLLAWAKAEKLPISIRLVKGAYWDSETVIAKQNGWDIPVWTIKAESDAAFERQAGSSLKTTTSVISAAPRTTSAPSPRSWRRPRPERARRAL